LFLLRAAIHSRVLLLCCGWLQKHILKLYTPLYHILEELFNDCLRKSLRGRHNFERQSSDWAAVAVSVPLIKWQW